MYGHAFTYLLFHLHFFEFIYLKLDFFQWYSICIMSFNIAQPFLSLMYILTLQYDKIYQYMYAHAFTTPKLVNFDVYLTKPRQLVLVDIL